VCVRARARAHARCHCVHVSALVRRGCARRRRDWGRVALLVPFPHIPSVPISVASACSRVRSTMAVCSPVTSAHTEEGVRGGVMSGAGEERIQSDSAEGWVSGPLPGRGAARWAHLAVYRSSRQQQHRLPFAPAYRASHHAWCSASRDNPPSPHIRTTLPRLPPTPSMRAPFLVCLR
jgi:hypothetical protein